MEIHGKLVDIHNRKIYSAAVTVEDGIITKIEPDGHRGEKFILPGFVDAHIHLESTYLPPASLARLAVRHGTIAAVCHPEEMSKALGLSGIEYLIDQARQVPFKFYFSAPTHSHLSLAEIEELWEHPEVISLFALPPETSELAAKIHSANAHNKPIMTLPPTTLSEARANRKEGKHILLSDLGTLYPLIQEDPTSCSLCTDHFPPDKLLLGHIGSLVKRAVARGIDPIDAIIAATKSPVEHYNLDVGLLRVGDPADFILVEDLATFRTHATYIKGNCVFKDEPLFPKVVPKPINRFEAKPIQELSSDILHKLVKVDRFGKDPIEITPFKTFRLEKGAIAASRGDSIIGLGSDDQEIRDALNAVNETQGGLALSYKGKTQALPLPIAGLLSDLEGEEMARKYSDFAEAAKNFGLDEFLTIF